MLLGTTAWFDLFWWGLGKRTVQAHHNIPSLIRILKSGPIGLKFCRQKDETNLGTLPKFQGLSPCGWRVIGVRSWGTCCCGLGRRTGRARQNIPPTWFEIFPNTYNDDQQPSESIRIDQIPSNTIEIHRNSSLAIGFDRD